MAIDEENNTELEIARLREERLLREAEIILRGKEIELHNIQSNNNKFFTQMFSPSGVAIVVGLIGLLGTAVSLMNTADIEEKKRQSDLLMKWYERNEGKDEKKGFNELLNLKEFGYIKIPPETEKKLRDIIGIKKNESVPPPLLGPIPTKPEAVKIFWDSYRVAFGPLQQSTIDGVTQIFDFIKKENDIKDIPSVAYILATIKWETAHTFVPTEEIGSEDYLENRYGPKTGTGQALGNTEPGDGVRYKGRGYLHLTGRKNYELMNQVLNLARTDNDLIEHPEKALEPLIAYRIASYAMQNGTFTGHKLSDYIKSDKVDYVNARRVYNGLDKAEAIADLAGRFESILRESLSQKEKQ